MFVCSVTQSCLTLCDPRDCSPPGSSVYGNFQARILSGLPFPIRGDLPDPEIKPSTLVPPALAGRFFTPVPPSKPVFQYTSDETIYRHQDISYNTIYNLTNIYRTRMLKTIKF